jgi:hypothetical protein
LDFMLEFEDDFFYWMWKHLKLPYNEETLEA